MSKRKQDVLSQYTIRDLIPPKWWEFWRESHSNIDLISLLCEGADVLDKEDLLLTLQHKRAHSSWLTIVGDKAYCHDCKILVRPNWTGGATPESYSAECPHCGFLFAEN